MLELVHCGVPSWDFEVAVVPHSEADRRCGLISGPLFTSKRYPWPQTHGTFHTPVIQVNLDDACLLSGLPLGDGLLQVWASDEINSYPDIHHRVIPECHLQEPLADLPMLVPGVNYDETFISTLGSSGTPEFLARGCRQIIGYSEAYFMVPDGPLSVFFCDLEVMDIGARARRLLNSYKTQAARCEIAGGTHLFGTFPTIQYSADERPQPLLSLDSDPPFWWGDMGHAQVYFEFLENAEVEFSCEWSTT